MWTAWAWKWTLRKNLEKDENLDITFIKSYVSRAMRDWEVDGDIYNFISEERFKEMISHDEFLEYEIVHKTAYYWTKLADVVDNWINAWIDVCKEVDIEWLKNILKNNPHLKNNVTSIFLSLTPEKLYERIEARWAHMTEQEFTFRKESLIKEVREAQEYCNYIIDTSEKTPEEVLGEVEKILKK